LFVIQRFACPDHRQPDFGMRLGNRQVDDQFDFGVSQQFFNTIDLRNMIALGLGLSTLYVQVSTGDDVEDVEGLWGPQIDIADATPCVAATTAKHLTAAKPAHENNCFWWRYIERFTIRFLVLKLNVLAQSFRNGMPWRSHPETFMIVTFAPSEVAIGTHQRSE